MLQVEVQIIQVDMLVTYRVKIIVNQKVIHDVEAYSLDSVVSGAVESISRSFPDPSFFQIAFGDFESETNSDSGGLGEEIVNRIRSQLLTRFPEVTRSQGRNESSSSGALQFLSALFDHLQSNLATDSESTSEEKPESTSAAPLQSSSSASDDRQEIFLACARQFTSERMPESTSAAPRQSFSSASDDRQESNLASASQSTSGRQTQSRETRPQNESGDPPTPDGSDSSDSTKLPYWFWIFFLLFFLCAFRCILCIIVSVFMCVFNASNYWIYYVVLYWVYNFLLLTPFLVFYYALYYSLYYGYYYVIKPLLCGGFCYVIFQCVNDEYHLITGSQ